MRISCHSLTHNNKCIYPIAAKRCVERNSMYMVTSTVFGANAAEYLGYAKAELQERLVNEDYIGRIVVYLKPTPQVD
jgi:hypothetical protein